MKKILRILVISFLLFSNASAEERSNKLEKLFTQLKNTIGAKIINDINGKYFIIMKISSVRESFFTVM